MHAMSIMNIQSIKVAGGRNLIWRALDVLEFDEDVRPAMEWVFGGVFICANPDVAKRVCFDKSIMKACVTLEGKLTLFFDG